MASAKAQRKWRDKHRFVKRQLNVMARKPIHDFLDDIAASYGLKGKGEAVAFACFITEALKQRADFNTEAGRMLDIFAETYHRHRDVYTP